MVTEDTTRLGTEGEEQARDSDVGVAKGLGRLSLPSSLLGSSPRLSKAGVTYPTFMWVSGDPDSRAHTFAASASTTE